MPFSLLFYAFLIGYPLMQALTLIRGRGALRLVSVACLLFGAPFYLWTLSKMVGPQPQGDLSGILILFMAPWFLLAQAVLTLLVFTRRSAD